MLLYIDSNLQLMYNNIDFNFGKVNHMKKLLLILNSILLIAVTCACTSNASPSVNDIPTASPDALPSADVSPTPSDEDKFAQTKRVTHYMDFSDTTGKIINNKLKNMAKAVENNCVEDTNIRLAKKKDPNQNNKIGVRGVWYNKNTDRYVAYISFQKKKRIIGRYKTLEEAKYARKRAEKERDAVLEDIIDNLKQTDLEV